MDQSREDLQYISPHEPPSRLARVLAAVFIIGILIMLAAAGLWLLALAGEL